MFKGFHLLVFVSVILFYTCIQSHQGHGDTC